MMSKTRGTIILCLSIFMMIGVVGCMKNDKSEMDNSLDERMVDYMNARYDDTFYFKEPYIYNKMQREICVRSDKFSAADDYIYVGYEKVGDSEIFCDNYLYFKYRKQTTAFLEEVLAEVFGYDFKLFYGDEPGIGTNRILAAGASFEDYISNWISDIRFTAVLAPGYEIDDRGIFAKKIKDIFVTHKTIITSATVHFCDDYVVYDSLDKETLNDFLISYERNENKKPTLDMSWIGAEKESFDWR